MKCFMPYRYLHFFLGMALPKKPGYLLWEKFLEYQVTDLSIFFIAIQMIFIVC